MSNKTIEMFTIRQVLRLYASGRGTKYISQSTGVARNTVKKYLYRYVQLKITLEELDRMSDAQMSKAFLVKQSVAIPDKRVTDLEALLPSLVSMLKKRGVTKQMVYEKYIASCPDGYKSSAFRERLNAFTHQGKGSMRMEHKAGDKMFVDYTGKKLQVVDKLNGEITDVEVFVAILGCSQLTFVMAMVYKCEGLTSRNVQASLKFNTVFCSKFCSSNLFAISVSLSRIKFSVAIFLFFKI
jgi:transposase